MKVLVIGGGGREHALCWKLKQDNPALELFIAPGNAGTARLGHNVPIGATDIFRLVEWAQKEKPVVTIVGPEAPLCAGVVDAFAAAGFFAFGPNQKAAQLEGSKAFTKKFMLKYSIPTARAECFTDMQEALKFSEKLGYPQAIKADGLAAGKGVILPQNASEAREALADIMERRVFGEAGALVVIEEFLEGREASLHIVTDGKSYALFPAAQDHKRVGDNDTGLNTGGMGAFAPTPFFTPEIREAAECTIVRPVLEGLRSEGIDYRGILYAGLMLTSSGPKVIEFNVRFGDPETQVLLPLLETPFLDLVQAVQNQTLDQNPPRFGSGSAVGIVLAAAGYPAEPRLGDAIKGLGPATTEGKVFQGEVFQSGTQLKDGNVVTSGGRVLTVTAWAPTLAQAREEAYRYAVYVHFEGAHYRKDIGVKT